MGFISWLTGRDKKSSDVYNDYDKVETVVNALTTIATTNVTNAQTEVNSAIQQFLSVNGMPELLQKKGINITVGCYDGLFTSASETIKSIGEQIQKKSDDIKTYEESKWYEKLASTFAMGGFKLAEGVLSVAEDLGDGIVSIVGWFAFKDSAIEKACENFVKKELSHDAFNFYYNSDFAKKSLISEDSAIAGGLKVIGKTVGTLYGAGVFAGATGLSGVSSATGFLNTSGTTWSAAIIGGMSGLGSGTETGLLKGKTINEAVATDGIKTGLIQGGLAFAGGKLGERAAIKNSAGGKEGYKQVVDNYKNAEKAMKGLEKETAQYNQAAKALDTARETANSYGTRYMTDASGEIIRDASGNAIRTGGVGIQGYSDAITNAGIRFGEAQRDLVSSSAKVFAGGKAGKEIDKKYDAAKSNYEQAREAADKAGEKAKNSGVERLESKYKDDYASDAADANLKAEADLKNRLAQEANQAEKSSMEAKKAFDKASEEAKNGYNALKQNQREAWSKLKTSNPFTQLTGKEKDLLIGAAGQSGTTAANAASNAAASSNSIKETAKSIPTVIKNALTSPGAPGVALTAAGNAYSVFNNDNASSTAKSRINEEKTEPTPTPNPEPTPDGDGATSSTSSSDSSSGNNSTSSNNSNGGGSGYSGGGGGGGGGYSGGSPDYIKEIPTSVPTTPKTVEMGTGVPTTSVPTVPSTNVPPTTVPTAAPQNNPSYSNGGTYTPSGDNGGGYYSGGGGTYYQPADQSYTGGGEYGENGFLSDASDIAVATDATDELEPLDESLLSGSTSIDDIIRNNTVTKVKTNAPITTKGKSSGASTVIPLAAGLSAAAAAGIGAKAYMDSRNNNDMDEEDDEMEDEEWSEDYENGQNEADMGDEYLDNDEYGYQANDLGYNARSSEELAELQ